MTIIYVLPQVSYIGPESKDMTSFTGRYRRRGGFLIQPHVRSMNMGKTPKKHKYTRFKPF